MKVVFVGLGFVFFALGAVGAFLPILPTTPFLLLASFFFAKGSDRFNTWFISTKLYHTYLESYIKHRSMTLKIKLCICGLATAMLAFAFVVTDVIFARIFFVVFILIMYFYFAFRIKTISPEEYAQIKATESIDTEEHPLKSYRDGKAIPTNTPIETDDGVL